MSGTGSRLRRLASFLARLFPGRSGPSTSQTPQPSTRQPPHASAEELAAFRAAFTHEEQTLLTLRIGRGLSWSQIAEALTGNSGATWAEEMRLRYEKILERLSRRAEENGRGSPKARAAAKPFGQLAVAEVARLVGDSGARLFDLRSSEAYARGHLPGATRMAPGDVVRNLPADKKLHLVYYGENARDLCCHGAAWAAAQAGYPNVFIMPAGLDGWMEAGHRVEVDG